MATRKICVNPARKAPGMWGGHVEVLFVSFGIQCMHWESAYDSAYTPILHSDGRSGRQRRRLATANCWPGPPGIPVLKWQNSPRQRKNSRKFPFVKFAVLTGIHATKSYHSSLQAYIATVNNVEESLRPILEYQTAWNRAMYCASLRRYAIHRLVWPVCPAPRLVDHLQHCSNQHQEPVDAAGTWWSTF